MADADRKSVGDLAWFRELAERPHAYGFYSTLRRLECAFTDKPRWGESLRPRDDPVRLGQEPSLSFAPSTLASVIPASDARPPRLEVLFLGLFGPNGPLPLHLTEYARDRLRNFHDPTLARFADIFHHRILSLFYRAWANANPAVSFDRFEADRFRTYVGATYGQGMPSLQDRDALPDLAKLYFAGHLSCQNRNADGLERMVSAFFRLPARIDEFVGHWMELPTDSLCRLGRARESATLGISATIGARVWDCQSRFRIVFGPLRLEDYKRLLPGGTSLPRLIAMVRNYVNDELSWDVQLILHRDEVPEPRLGSGIQLGWTTVLAAGTPQRDVDDLRLEPLLHHATGPVDGARAS